MQHNLLINGKLVAGEGEKVPVYNPATGEVIPEIAEATAARVDAAVEAADRAFDALESDDAEDACGMSPEAGGRHLGAG